MEQYFLFHHGFLSLFLSEKLSKEFSLLWELGKAKMAECVNKVSQEDPILRHLLFMSFLSWSRLMCLLGLLASCFSKDTADPFWKSLTATISAVAHCCPDYLRCRGGSYHREAKSKHVPPGEWWDVWLHVVFAQLLQVKGSGGPARVWDAHRPLRCSSGGVCGSLC